VIGCSSKSTSTKESRKMRFRHVLRESSRRIRWQAKIIALRSSAVRAGRRHTLPGQLIVSLTSYPARFATLDLTLRTLLSQEMKPDAVVLWLARGDQVQLPQCVLRLQTHGLVIRESEDTRSFLKIIPALSAYPNAFIVTADDDVQYHKGWLRRLVEECRGRNEILCHIAHRVVLTMDGHIAPYREWPKLVVGKTGATGLGVFPLGHGGVLYPPNSLSPDVMNAAEFMRLCPYGDDIWLYWMACRAGTPRRVIKSFDPPKEWPGTQGPGLGLWLNQNKDGGTDRQIAAMIEACGMPEGGISTLAPPFSATAATPL
jgi:hypothetical protein